LLFIRNQYFALGFHPSRHIANMFSPTLQLLRSYHFGFLDSLMQEFSRIEFTESFIQTITFTLFAPLGSLRILSQTLIFVKFLF